MDTGPMDTTSPNRSPSTLPYVFAKLIRRSVPCLGASLAPHHRVSTWQELMEDAATRKALEQAPLAGGGVDGSNAALKEALSANVAATDDW